jgi:hypothetical protein
MFWWIVGGIVLFYAFAMLVVLALCKAASDADDWSEQAYEELKKQEVPFGEEYKWN